MPGFQVLVCSLPCIAQKAGKLRDRQHGFSVKDTTTPNYARKAFRACEKVPRRHMRPHLHLPNFQVCAPPLEHSPLELSQSVTGRRLVGRDLAGSTLRRRTPARQRRKALGALVLAILIQPRVIACGAALPHLLMLLRHTAFRELCFML
jgi:hypothetical protein